jgi:hypothetical protein
MIVVMNQLDVTHTSKNKCHYTIQIPKGDSVIYKQFSVFLNKHSGICATIIKDTLDIKAKQPITVGQLQKYFIQIKKLDKTLLYSFLVGSTVAAVGYSKNKKKNKNKIPLDLVSLKSQEDVAQFARISVAYEKNNEYKEMYKSLIRRGCYTLVSNDPRNYNCVILNLNDLFTKTFLEKSNYINIKPITDTFTLIQIQINLQQLYSTWETTWYDDLISFFDSDPPKLVQDDSMGILISRTTSSNTEENVIKIAVVGELRSGKSACINLIFGDSIPEHHWTDEEPDAMIVSHSENLGDFRFIVDEIPYFTPGNYDSASFFKKYKLRKYDEILLMVPTRFTDYHDELMNMANSFGVRIFMVLIKDSDKYVNKLIETGKSKEDAFNIVNSGSDPDSIESYKQMNLDSKMFYNIGKEYEFDDLIRLRHDICDFKPSFWTLLWTLLWTPDSRKN